MIPRFLLPLAAAALVALGLATPSLGQPAGKFGPDAHRGEWAFKTESYGLSKCVLSGRMRITKSRTGAEICTFQAIETCRDWRYKAEQTCTIARSGDTLTITSRIVRADTPSYRADDFKVTLESTDKMRGTMSSVYQAPVEFRRSVQAIS
jgi:hypothetical protein